MSLAIDIVKRGRKDRSEPFNRQKLHGSIIAVCLSTRTPEGEAELIAEKVCDSVEKWLEQRPEITSRDLRVAASRHLKKLQPEAAYLYEQYHITI